MLSIFLYFLIGIFAGTLSGLLGIGGGIIVIPGLMLVFTISGFPNNVMMHMVVGTALMIMICTASSALFAYYRRDYVDWTIIRKFLPSILIGVISGALLGRFLSTQILQILFALFLLFVSVQMFLLVRPKPTRILPKWKKLSFIGYVIGLKSGLLGIGGGSIIIPFLTYCNVPMRRASGSSIACSLLIAIVGTIIFMLTGYHVMQMPYTIGFIYLPAFLIVAVTSVIFAPIGAWMGSKIHINIIKRIFAVFVFVVAIKLLF